MNIDPIRAAFESDLSGFTGPLNQAMTVIDRMVDKLGRMARAGSVAAAQMASAASKGAVNVAQAVHAPEMSRLGLSPYDVGDWETYIADRTTKYWQQVTAREQKKQQQKQQQRANRVTSGLATQRVKEEEKQQRLIEQQRRQEEREARRMAAEEERQRKARMKVVSNVGMGTLAGTAAGYNAGNPLLGALHGAVGGAFAGGPWGALAGGIAGVAGGGFGLFMDGLGVAVDLTKTLVSETVKLGMAYEKNLAFFTAFTGSTESARGVMSGLQQSAIQSPFKFSDLTGPAGLLMGYGMDPGNVTGAVSRLSMVAAGDSTRMQRLALAFAQTQAHGKLMGQELRQFAESGVGAEDFAATMGITAPQLKKLMKTPEGVGANVVVQTINRLTGEGGRYAKVNEELLNSVEGRVNQLVETVQMKLGEAAAKLFKDLKVGETIAGITASVGPLVEQYMPMLEETLRNATLMAGDLFGLMEESLPQIGLMLKDMSDSPFGKMLIPDTWQEARMAVAGFTTTMAVSLGVMMDMGRAAMALVDTLVAGAKLGAMVGSLGTAVSLKDVDEAFTNAGKANIDLIANPFKNTERMTQASSASMLQLAKDLAMENLTGKPTSSALERLRNRTGRSMGVSPALITEKDIAPFAAVESELEKMRKKLLGESGAGVKGKSRLDQFEKEMKDITRMANLEEEARRLFPTANAITNRPQWVKKMEWMEDNRLSASDEAEARYNAYLRLKSGVDLRAQEVRLPSGMAADTAEASRLQLEMSNRDETKNTQDEIKRVLEEANRQREELKKEMEDFNKFIRENSIVFGAKTI